MKRSFLVFGLLLCLSLAVGMSGCQSMTKTSDDDAPSVTTTVTSVTEGGAPPTITAITQTRWTQLRTTGQLPPGRVSSSLVYDPSGRRVILFGGGTETGDFDDTWAFDPATDKWTDLAPTGAVPSARQLSPLVYDPVSRNLFLFGGWDQERERDLGDTWAYDTAGNVWTKLDPAGKVPSGRDGHSLVYDPLSKRLILFGGSDQDAAEHNDLWAYDPAANTWEQLETTGELPPVRAWHCAVYDAQNHQMLVFGGASGEDDETYRNDTWAYDLKANTWTELAPRGDLPAKLQNSAMIYDPLGHRAILYGGATAGGGLRETWAYDPSTNTWADLKPAGSAPAVSVGHSMVYEPEGDRVLIFGGFDVVKGEMANQIWACKPGAAPEAPAGVDALAPSPRLAHTLVYDPVKQQVILFGGSFFSEEDDDSYFDYDDTWAYDSKSVKWTELHPSGDIPAARSAHAVAYDAQGERMIMFGGSSETSGFNDTWSYDSAANAWTELEPAGEVPAARDGHAMAYDPVSGNIILFGGEDGLIDLGDTWSYDPQANRWTELRPRGRVPAARCFHSLVYDPVGKRMILFGGSIFAEEEMGVVGMDDAWAYDPQANTWTELDSPRNAPSARHFTALVYDPVAQRMILFGGSDDEGYEDLSDTWRYDPAANTWAEFAPEEAVPPGRENHSLVYDPSVGRVILFGGWGYEDGLYNDIWQYDTAANTWIELLPSTEDIQQTFTVVLPPV